MSGRTRRTLAAVLVVIAPLPASASATAAVAPPTQAPSATHSIADLRLPTFGAVYHGMWDLTWRDRSRLLDKLDGIGAEWVRIGVQWSLIQPRKPTADDPGYGMRWAVPKADRVIEMAHRRGFKISVTFLRTPGWANGDRGPTYLPDDVATYARAARWMADRYRDQVQAWEVWNEPNHDNHLRGGGAPRYTELLCAAYPAIHRGDPSTRVVFGGTAGNAWGFTEVGWSTHRNTPSTPSWKRGVPPKEQARYAAQTLRITAREFRYVRRVFWYSAMNERTGDLENDNFGLYTRDLRPKPSAIRVREVLRRHA